MVRSSLPFTLKPVAGENSRYFATPGGLLLGILGGGVPPDSPNPDPITDQKM